jgi:hypothetical protein
MRPTVEGMNEQESNLGVSDQIQIQIQMYNVLPWLIDTYLFFSLSLFMHSFLL